jgi:outer membrane protein assembly factor BamB
MAALALVFGCQSAAEAPSVPVHFLRGALERGGTIEARAYQPGETVDGVVAPHAPECRSQLVIPLEDRRADAEQGAPPAGAALAFSPDSATLVIGSVEGAIKVVRVPSGAVVAEKQLAEGSVKQVAYSHDGSTIYVGEQSPDAYVYALDAATLTERWKLRLADDIASSALPADDTMYGRFSLPGAYAVQVLRDGRVLVAGAHGWITGEGRQNRARLYVLSAAGEQLAAYPSAGAADGIFLFPSVYEPEEGPGDVLLGVARSADGPAPDGLPVGGLLDLSSSDLSMRWSTLFPPLTPWFKDVYFWEAVVRGPGFAFAGLGDGRAFMLDETGKSAATLQPGIPVLTGGVPIGVGVGFATANRQGVWYLTTSTNIPWGSADPAARPPSAHPAENTVHAVKPDGTPRWDRQLHEAVAGVVLSPDGSELLVGAGPRESDTRTDLFGAVVLDAATGKTITTCSTVAPTDFRPVYAPDGGWIAVTEAPFKTGDGSVSGAYQVTVFR